MNDPTLTFVSPMSASTVATLRRLRDDVQSTPRESLDPGAVSRLLGDGLIEVVQMKSPYVSHRGRMISHVRITEAGRRVLQEKGSTNNA